ncbi:MAG: putative 2-aminoethylphosphonate ABC transporter substrate-binding protein [Solidesulfovibrio sp. DCME]|uniref:putative 2-aminoethylphosphonate ABC transporter substrate-binding protein n=1 Tax=Solidesulfovibrio sp. DCME TaxID=3447380 RepID=UPI003D0EFB9E
MKRLVLSLVLLVAFSTHALAAELLVYTALEDDQIPRYIKSFKEQNPGIDVKFVRDSTGIVTSKLLAEKDNPQADVIWGLSAVSLMQLKQAGLLAPYDPKEGAKVSAQFKDAATPPAWYGIDAWMTGFCVNTVELGAKKLPMPESYADLVKPEYKGLVVMPNPASSGTGFLTVSAILQLLGEEKGWAYLDALHDNIGSYTHSGSKPCKLAGTGEAVIGVSFGYRGLQQKKKGEPIATVFPKEGSGWDLEANALVNKAAIKPEAKAFLDWALSMEAMKEYAQSFAVTGYPTGTPIPEGYPADPGKQMIKNDFDWAAKNRDRILAEWSKRYDGKSEAKK